MRTARVLHLSDPHFSREYFYFINNKTRLPRATDLAEALVQDWTPDAVLLTGDVAWSGKSEEYQYAADFVTALREQLPDSVRIVIIPGNHDVNFAPHMHDERRQRKFVEFLKAIYSPNELTTIYPLLAKRYSGHLTLRERIAPIVVDELMTIAGINSAAYLRSKQGAGGPMGTPIYVRPLVLREMGEMLRTLEPTTSGDRIRIFMLHHHLLPFLEQPWGKQIDPDSLGERPPDDDLIANSGHLQQWLGQHSFDVALHGHKHVPHGRSDQLYVSPDSAPSSLIVIGAGSVGVEQGHRVGDLSFNRIEVRKSGRGDTQVEVEVGSPAAQSDGIAISAWNRYTVTEPRVTDAVVALHATDTADAYEQIRAITAERSQVTNFLCVVDSSEYLHPDSALMEFEDVVRAFQALNPQMQCTSTSYACNRWRIHPMSHEDSHQLRHGDYVFEPAGESSRWDLAIAAFGTERHRRAYINLFDTTRDAAPEPPNPPPGLVGIQLVSSDGGRTLGLTATFRHLELSNFFLVNCFEMCVLINTALRERRAARDAIAGPITFFASQAEWDADQPLTKAAWMDLNHGGMQRLVDTITDGNGDTSKAIDDLARLFEDKVEVLHPSNVDIRGLDVFLKNADELRLRSPHWDVVLGHVTQARALLQRVIADRHDARPDCDEAQDLLRTAVAALRSSM